MKQLTTICILLLSFLNGYSQIKKDTIAVNISGRIDTTYNADVKEIYHLFKNYLESRPDSIYDNPYWNSREKVERKGANASIFYMAFYTLETTPKIIFKNNWKPFVLTIEKKNEAKYTLRIAFIRDTLTADKILTIINVNAIKENNHWVLENTLDDIVNSWNTKWYKNIKYVYPKTHIFNDTLAQKSVRFCDSVTALLQIKNVDTLNFYICDNPDELGLLHGFEYYYLNYATGMTNMNLHQIYSSKGNEFYPHEFVHMILNGITDDSMCYIIAEGFACFFGELNTPKYDWQIASLAKDYIANKTTYALDNLLNLSTENNSYPTAYPTGSIILEIVYEKKGYAGLRALANSNTLKPENIYKAIYTIIKLDKIQFEKEFRKKLVQHQKEGSETNKK
jgi:hypothetical protein